VSREVCHPAFTQELPGKLPPTRAKEGQSHVREEALIYDASFVARSAWRRTRKDPGLSTLVLSDGPKD
jgi:hypothetical protein